MQQTGCFSLVSHFKYLFLKSERKYISKVKSLNFETISVLVRVETVWLSETIGTDRVRTILIYSILMTIPLHHCLNMGVDAGINSEIKCRLKCKVCITSKNLVHWHNAPVAWGIFSFYFCVYTHEHSIVRG